MIQPLVENAVIHGMEPVNRPCTIVITAKHQLDENGNPVVLIVVRDDGAGFNVENIDLHTSIGLVDMIPV
jgi:two-component system sensor histidine kinase YesM